MTSAPTAFWRHLLTRRVVSWGNFSWFSARTLLLSVNDQIANSVEKKGDRGSIVDRRRMRWVASQRTRGVNAYDAVRIHDAGFVALGDPGEMDASQYVLVRDLALVRDSLRNRGVNTVLLMSDIVYPAGDINDWRDAVYLPYLGLPKHSWDEAVAKWRASCAAGGLDGPSPAMGAGPLLDCHLLALPGNHDWYDGLNGFMYHACGAEPLPEVTYDTEGFNARQRIARAWWRYPAPPKRELLAPLRTAMARTEPAAASGAPLMAPPASMPRLPGPYYAVDLGCADADVSGHEHGPSCPPLIRLVLVDNGVTGSIDVEQADWIETMLSQNDLPKIVVTGKPVAVNNSVDRFVVAEYGGTLTDDDRSRDLVSLMKAGSNVVATLAGDIHNYQRFVFLESGPVPKRAPETWQVADPAPSTLPPVQVVAGGGGAFLAATHGVRLEQDDSVILEVHPAAPEVSPTSPDHPVQVPPERHRLFPRREESVRHYARRVSALYLGIGAALAVLGLVAALAMAWWSADLQSRRLDLGFGSVGAGVFVGFPWLVLLLVGVASVAAFRVTSRWQHGPRAVALVGIGLGSAAALAAAGWWLDLDDLVSILLADAAIVLILLAHYITPLLQSFPRIGRALPTRLVVVALLVRGVVLVERRPVLVVAAAAAALVLTWAGVKLYRAWCRRVAREQLLADRQLRRVAVARLVPGVVVSLIVVILTLVVPGKTLAVLGLSSSGVAEEAVRFLSMSTLLVVTAVVLVFAHAVPFARVRRLVPPSTWRYAVLGAVIGGAALWLVWGRAGDAAISGLWAHQDWWWLGLLLLVVSAILGALAGLLAAHWVAALTGAGPTVEQPTLEEIHDALRQRDLGPGAAVHVPARTFALATSMALSAVPSLQSMAEASQPPFLKNMLVVTCAKAGDRTIIEFEAFGIDDESAPAAAPYDPARLPAERSPSGFYPIDRFRLEHG